MSTYNHRTARMVYNIVANTTKNGTPNCTKSSGAHHNHGNLLLIGHINNDLTRTSAEHSFDLTRNLTTTKQTKHTI